MHSSLGRTVSILILKMNLSNAYTSNKTEILSVFGIVWLKHDKFENGDAIIAPRDIFK